MVRVSEKVRLPGLDFFVKEVGRIEDSKEKTNFSLFKEVKLDQFFD
jgi:hypothetical protein